MPSSIFLSSISMFIAYVLFLNLFCGDKKFAIANKHRHKQYFQCLVFENDMIQKNDIMINETNMKKEK